MKNSLALLLAPKHSNSTKRALLLLAFALLAARGFSQNADSLLMVKVVDSLPTVIVFFSSVILANS